jgi:hypothetical protein
MLREGLPSKIYLLAYNGPITGYAIAQKIYGIKSPAIPPTSKVYNWIKKMKTDKLLSETENGGLCSNAEPLLNEIIKTLKVKKMTLTEAEKRTVLKLINSSNFRILTQIMNEDENKIDRDTDAVTILLQTVGMIAFYLYVAYIRVTAVTDEQENTNENTVNNSINATNTTKHTTKLLRLEVTLNEGPEGLTQFEDGMLLNDQKFHEEMKKKWLGDDKESRSDFILVVAMTLGCVISKELTEKLSELSFFKYLFSLFSNERTFRLLECWREKIKDKE